MEVTITREPGDHVVFESRLVREERRPNVELLDAGRPASEYELAICGWCKRIGIDNAWLEVEDAMRELELFGWAILPRLSHKVCDGCNVMLQREMDAIS